MRETLLHIAVSITIPIVWGVAVNWMFNLWRDRTRPASDKDRIFPDYQI